MYRLSRRTPLYLKSNGGYQQDYYTCPSVLHTMITTIVSEVPSWWEGLPTAKYNACTQRQEIIDLPLLSPTRVLVNFTLTRKQGSIPNYVQQGGAVAKKCLMF